MYLSDFRTLDTIQIADAVQNSFGSHKKSSRILMVAWFNLFSFEYPSQSLGNIGVERIEQEKEVETTAFPYFSHPIRFTATVSTGVIEDKHSRFVYGFTEIIQKLRDIHGLDRFTTCKSMGSIVVTTHIEDIESYGLYRRNKNVLFRELPSIRHISLCADMVFVPKVEVNKSVIVQMFKFLQLLAFIRIELRQGIHLWAFGDTLISCTKTPKKRLNVMSIAIFPDDFSQLDFATFTRYLSCFIVSSTSTLSLACLQALFYTYVDVYRFVQLNAERILVSSFWATFLFDRFRLLRSRARQRIRKWWVEELLRCPDYNTR